MYRFFYNREAVGDVLIIVFDAFKDNDHQINSEDVVSLYSEGKLVGINIFNFSKICRIHSKGMIPAPSKEFLQLVNHILINASLEALPEIDSGFKVGLVVECEVHPETDHLHIAKVDVGDQILAIVCGASNIEKGQKIIVAMPGTIMFDGSVIVPSLLRGEKSEGMICSSRDLHEEDSETKRGIIVLDKDVVIGSDYF